MKPKQSPKAKRLWYSQDFILFWWADAVSLAGTLITSVALPILVFQLTGSAFLTSLTTAFRVLPYLFFGFIAGVVADRISRKRLMISCDLLNALLLGSLPLAALFKVLTLPQVLLVSLASAIVFVWFDAANWGAVPALVGRERVAQANSLIWTTNNLTDILIPSLAGGLVAFIGPALTISLDAISYVISAVALLFISRSFSTERNTSSLEVSASSQATSSSSLLKRTAKDIGEGLQFIWQHQLVRMMTLLGFGNSLTSGAVTGLLIVYVVKVLGLSQNDARLGLIYTAGAIGTFIITLLLPWLVRRLGVGWVTLIGMSATPLAIIGMVLAPNFLTGCIFYLAWAACYSGVVQNGISFRQTVTPDALLSRVNTTARMIAWGGAPFGAALGGTLAELLGVRLAYLIMALAVASSALIGWFSPLRAKASEKPDTSKTDDLRPIT